MAVAVRSKGSPGLHFPLSLSSSLEGSGKVWADIYEGIRTLEGLPGKTAAPMGDISLSDNRKDYPHPSRLLRLMTPLSHICSHVLVSHLSSPAACRPQSFITHHYFHPELPDMSETPPDPPLPLPPEFSPNPTGTPPGVPPPPPHRRRRTPPPPPLLPGGKPQKVCKGGPLRIGRYSDPTEPPPPRWGRVRKVGHVWLIHKSTAPAVNRIPARQLEVWTRRHIDKFPASSS